MGADTDEVCGAPYGTVSPDRVNRRNGYRTRPAISLATSSPQGPVLAKLRLFVSCWSSFLMVWDGDHSSIASRQDLNPFSCRLGQWT